ncbi:MAG: NAD(P)-dependent oxidoreductase [Candidatus Rokubacteria bacterium]|nr:NAD(P)-dependent oxidoreductase [Candidatus Rokubacteria bacterium]
MTAAVDPREEPIGFIGVGKIGAPMARRLVDHGRPVHVFDVVPTTREQFAGQGRAVVAASVGEVFQHARTVLLSLPSPQALEDVLLGASGERLGQGYTIIDLSTSGVQAARRVAEALGRRGVDYVDAPVSGGVRGAAAGTLSVMVAATTPVFERVKPLLEEIGKNVFHVGREPGQGQAMKLVNNMLSATTLAATAEAMVVAAKAGLAPKLALDVLNSSSGRSGATQDKFPRDVITGKFDYGFTVEHMLKDAPGQHNAEVFGALLGADERQLAEWRAKGII